MDKNIAKYIADYADIIVNDGVTQYGNTLSRDYCLEAIEVWLLHDAGKITLKDILNCWKAGF